MNSGIKKQSRKDLAGRLEDEKPRAVTAEEFGAARKRINERMKDFRKYDSVRLGHYKIGNVLPYFYRQI